MFTNIIIIFKILAFVCASICIGFFIVGKFIVDDYESKEYLKISKISLSIFIIIVICILITIYLAQSINL